MLQKNLTAHEDQDDTAHKLCLRLEFRPEQMPDIHAHRRQGEGDDPDEGHGGADKALTADFIKFIRNDNPSLSCTSIENSIAGHRVVFLADKSMAQGGQIMYI